MLEKPNLPDEVIVALLASHYDIGIDALEFLPVGNDQRAWSYRVVSESGAFFLKLRVGGRRPAALVVPHELQRMGIKAVVAPLPTQSGELFARGDEFDLVLYPHIKGKSAWGMPLSRPQAHQWGGIMRRIHSAELNPVIAETAPREVFGVKWLSTVERVDEIVARGDFAHEVAEGMARVWREQEGQMQMCRQRYLDLGARLAAQAPRFVLCHADIHTANIIIERDEAIRIVDWDETILAPKERDLMFFIFDGHDRDFSAAFFAGYGVAKINWLALAYYKYDWVMQEFADFGERVFISTEIGQRDLLAALAGFKRLFTEGDVIERARQAFARLVPSAG